MPRLETCVGMGLERIGLESIGGGATGGLSIRNTETNPNAVIGGGMDRLGIGAKALDAGSIDKGGAG